MRKTKMSNEFLITKMLNELKTARSSMKAQMAAITDVLDKSNNVLLQIEATRSLKPLTNDGNCMPYMYNKETVNVLTKVVDKFMGLLASSPNLSNELSNFEEYLEAESQKMEYLGCNVRKLLAIWDKVQQMRLALETQVQEATSDDELSENEVDF
ncbi:hypothetical protein DOY81_003401 [Sarcophaga bullata]|nr:hypothetical protein DOY81_003401 [Sarcophaga bullata]